MATVLDVETEQEVEAVLNAMESAAPGSRAECIGGNFSLNRPRTGHQRTQAKLLIAIAATLPDEMEVVTEPRVHQEGADTWIVPDLVIAAVDVLKQDLPVLDPNDIAVMVEVVSPSTESKDRGAKVEFCRRHNIDYWVVAPGDPWGLIDVHGFGDGRLSPPS